MDGCDFEVELLSQSRRDNIINSIIAIVILTCDELWLGLEYSVFQSWERYVQSMPSLDRNIKFCAKRQPGADY